VTRDQRAPRPFDPAGVVVACLLFVVATVIWWDTEALRITSVYGVGPKAVPYAVAIGLALLAIGNLVIAFSGPPPSRETLDPTAILLILAGLVALIVLIGLGGGFIPAAAILFAATSTAFGRRAPLTDLAIGVALGLLIFLMFDKVLTLALPEGPIERLL
jgi:putative tricarboxylic transport membrane protein